MQSATLPAIFRKLYPKAVWDIPTEEKVIYLTFDDGPIQEVTPKVLDLLDRFKAKATFFCLGRNVVENPTLFQRIVAADHTVGNHTYSHPNGWKTKTTAYLNDIKACAEVFDSKLFRPPYGKLKPKQYKIVSEQHQIIMWDVLSRDYDQKTTTEQCYHNVVNGAKSGSIIVFHDSIKAGRNVLTVLPMVLETLRNRGYAFHALKKDNFKKVNH